jgi:hypothetical protein
VAATSEGTVEHCRGAFEQRLDFGQQDRNVIDADASGLKSTDRAHVLREGGDMLAGRGDGRQAANQGELMCING